MRNPLARLVHRDPAKPTLRERAATLKASAARVMRGPKPVEVRPPTHVDLARATTGSLAEACDWAVNHYAWITAASAAEKWGDARINAEIDRYNLVWQRALAEPAGDLVALAAKARMFASDWAEHNPETGHDLLDKMLLSVLRDIAALHKARGITDHAAVAARQSISDLRALDETANLIHGFCSALSQLPYARDKGGLSAAGEFAERIADDALWLADACHKEAMRRALPAGHNDRGIQLALTARAVIENGDDEETLAFARDVASMVEARS